MISRKKYDAAGKERESSQTGRQAGRHWNPPPLSKLISKCQNPERGKSFAAAAISSSSSFMSIFSSTVHKSFFHLRQALRARYISYIQEKKKKREASKQALLPCVSFFRYFRALRPSHLILKGILRLRA